ncbi:MAG: CoA-binding protein [Saprospiraceae bacterium]|nr:CoA-binding protein [Saprospiraceae bacterium]
MSDRAELHQKNLEKIFNPQSVAIIGANQNKGTVPFDILSGILSGDFNGVIYPVSPGRTHISVLKAYKYVVDIEDPVDLGVIVFPSTVTHMALEQCGQKGIKSVVIISAGFREVGGNGIEREKQIVEIAHKYDISFIGPNCLGMINTDPKVRINASFARQMPAAGSIGFLSQSGALCTAVLDYAQAKGIGFSKFVSFGNKADISEVDLMYYLMRDEKTKVVLLYLEEVSDGPALMKAAKDIIELTSKPILIIKSGRTEEGASAAASHTGSLAGRDEICDAAFQQAGIIRCDHIEDMFNIATAFAYEPIPLSNRVAIITNAGGPGVLTTDTAIKEGLQLACFSKETTKVLKKALPNTANINNPVDVIGDATADRYETAMDAVFRDENVDGVFVILTPQSMTDIDTIAHKVVEVTQKYDKPVYTSFMGETDVASGIRILQQNQIPHYSLPESMSKAFAVTHQFGKLLQKAPAQKIEGIAIDQLKAKEIIQQAMEDGKTFLQEYEATELIKAYGLPVTKGILISSEKEAGQVARKVGFPVVMKVQSLDILHKVDVGGVQLNILTEEDAQLAYHSIISSVQERQPEARIQGVFITRQIPKGEEVILGLKRDPSFGPVIMFGLGGIFVEIFRDISFRVAPLAREEAFEMIKQVKAYKILAGARGRHPKDVEAIVDTILKLSQLAVDHPEITELDINPLIVLQEGKGCFAADVKILLREG